VTDFVDLHEIIENSGEKWGAGKKDNSIGSTILIVEQSSFARAHLRNSLELAGYVVVEATGFQEAVDKLAREKVRIVAASIDFAELAKHIKDNSKLSHIPLLGLLSDAGQCASPAVSHLFEDFQMKFDRKAMLNSLARLAAAVGQSEHELAGRTV